MKPPYPTRRQTLVLSLRGLGVGLGLGAALGSGCGGSDGNPPSLWLGFSVREVDLVLRDTEPPAF